MMYLLHIKVMFLFSLLFVTYMYMRARQTIGWVSFKDKGPLWPIVCLLKTWKNVER